MFRATRYFVLPAFLAVLPAMLPAAPITYKFSGTGTGTLNGTSFSNQTYNLTFYSDTTQIFNAAGVWETPLNPAGVFSVGAKSGAVADINLYLFSNPGQYAHAVGIGNNGATDHLDINDLSLLNYDFVSAFGPISTNAPFLGQGGTVTDSGLLIFTSATATFQAYFGGPPRTDSLPPATTPEPSTTLLAVPLALLWWKRSRG